MHYISDEKIKTTRDQVTTQSNISFKFCIVEQLWIGKRSSFKAIAVELEVSLYHFINPQRTCVRVTVVTFLCLSVCLSQLKMASFYLSKRASKHGRRLYKCVALF